APGGLAGQAHQPAARGQAGDAAAGQQGARGHLRPGHAARDPRRHRVEEEPEHGHEGQAGEELEGQRQHDPAGAHGPDAVKDVVELGRAPHQCHREDHEQGRGRQAPLPRHMTTPRRGLPTKTTRRRTPRDRAGAAGDGEVDPATGTADSGGAAATVSSCFGEMVAAIRNGHYHDRWLSGNHLLDTDRSQSTRLATMVTSVDIDEAPALPTSYSVLLIARLARTVNAPLECAIAPPGAGAPHTRALSYLRDHGPTPQGALGDGLRIDPSNLVGLLNDLDRQDLVVRRRDPADRP